MIYMAFPKYQDKKDTCCEIIFYAHELSILINATLVHKLCLSKITFYPQKMSFAVIIFPG